MESVATTNSLIKFNEQMSHFCSFLSDTFSFDAEVLSNISLLRLFQKTNVRKISEFFYTELYPYEKQINDMEENFFVELSKSNREKYSESNYGKEICNVIDMIHRHLHDQVMDQMCPESPGDTNRKRIWKYLRVLVFLSKKVHA